MRTNWQAQSMSLPGTSPEPMHFTPHASTRWARLVAGVLTSPVDLRTLEDWGRHMAVSRSALKAWCGLAKASPRRSLLLGRVLRAIEYRRRGMSFENSLDIRDNRTFRKLFDIAGRPDANDDFHSLLVKQHLVDDAELIAALTRVLGEEEECVSNQPWHPRAPREGQAHDVSHRPW